MNSKLTCSILAATITLVPTAVLAEISQESRCQSDSLDTTQVLERLDWARQCGLLTNTGGPASWVNSTHALDAVSVPPSQIVWAKEYVENNPNHAYSGNLEAYNVNYYYSWALYESTPMYTMIREASGFTSTYWKWSHTVQRARPMYPTFETSPVAGAGTQLFPGLYNTVVLPPPDPCGGFSRAVDSSLDSNINMMPICPLVADTTTSLTTQVEIDCGFYTDPARTIPYTGSNVYVSAYCESGCYTPDQSLRFSDGDVNILDAMKAQRDDLVTLTPDATLDNPVTQTSKVYSYITDIRDAEHIIYQITTASGGLLSVTNEHPLITQEGRLVKAEKLAAGDQLLKADGTPDRITGIMKTKYFGKVYNIKPVSREPVANILIAQG
ncbi:MAG TPA: Hint domain-containing protein, partial [Kofleriaceae bacterium]